jgi:hypothetical protein
MAENPPELLGAWRDAAQTTDPESARFALGCVQLNGKAGTVVATDGRQALVQSGFSFPWEDDVLVPANKVLGSRHLPADETVSIGRADDWAVFHVGPWTFWFSIETESRFPEVVSHIRQPETAVATVQFPEADRRFLLDNLPRLPGDEDVNMPVTVDLNGSVAIRGRKSGQTDVTELVLSASTRTGEPIRFNSNRKFLRRAVKLGFDRIHTFDNKSPVLACDDRRRFVWALLVPESTIAADDKVMRIESAAGNDESTSQQRTPRRRRKLVTNKTKQSKSNGAQTQDDNERSVDPIVAAQSLRDSLRESVRRTSQLIAALKHHRKRAKAVESTLASLRQLQEVGG